MNEIQKPEMENVFRGGVQEAQSSHMLSEAFGMLEADAKLLNALVATRHKRDEAAAESTAPPKRARKKQRVPSVDSGSTMPQTTFH